MGREIEIPHGWGPRPYQRDLWRYLENGGKRAVAVWHRRSGKDDVALHWSCVAAHLRPATYWHLLPQQAQARKAIWDAVDPHTGRRRIDMAFPHEVREGTRETDMTIRFKSGSTWQVVGSDNYDALVGSPPAGVVFSEWALADPKAWAILRPILLENQGWAIFIYTPRGRNHGLTLFETAQSEPGWYAQRLTADDTGVFTHDQLEQERREYIREYGPEDGLAYFMQEYFVSFDAPMVGSYYGSLLADAEREKRICGVPHDPALPVETWWDLGVRDSTAIWFVQRAGPEIHVIDYVEDNGKDVTDYVGILDDKRRERKLRYGDHVMPHDAEAVYFNLKKSPAAVFKELTGDTPKIIKAHDKNHGINAVRRMLPKVWFDKTRCARGLDCLRNYRREWDDKNKCYREHPLHDWSSDGADAFRYGAMFQPTKSNFHREMQPAIPDRYFV